MTTLKELRIKEDAERHAEELSTEKKRCNMCGKVDRIRFVSNPELVKKHIYKVCQKCVTFFEKQGMDI